MRWVITHGYVQKRDSLVMLREVTAGLSNKECAARMGISVKTVENHRAHVMAKLGLRDVVGLMRYALKHGLIEG